MEQVEVKRKRGYSGGRNYYGVYKEWNCKDSEACNNPNYYIELEKKRLREEKNKRTRLAFKEKIDHASENIIKNKIFRQNIINAVKADENFTNIKKIHDDQVDKIDGNIKPNFNQIITYIADNTVFSVNDKYHVLDHDFPHKDKVLKDIFKFEEFSKIRKTKNFLYYYIPIFLLIVPYLIPLSLILGFFYKRETWKIQSKYANYYEKILRKLNSKYKVIKQDLYVFSLFNILVNDIFDKEKVKENYWCLLIQVMTLII